MIVLLAFSFGSSFHEQSEQDFFAGFDALVWLIIFLGSVGGMIVSVIMRHFSNLLKTIAVSLALCGTVAVQTYFSVSSLSASWILSALVVVSAAYIFFESDTTKKKISPDISDV
jgi:membrane-bound acyltransferase YfiQ involved in biofilm formation